MRPQLLSLTFAAMLVACATPSASTSTWPDVNALPDAPPPSLAVDAPAAMLRQGTDGFLWLVGPLPAEVDAGSQFVARFSGNWPIAEMPRPALARGRVARRVSPKAAVVILEYEMPDTKLEGLEVTFETTMPEIGKGLAVVGEVSDQKVDLVIEATSGVRAGDVYGLVRAASGDAQLSRRLSTVCLVDRVDNNLASCRLWQGASALPKVAKPATGDTAVFLEHTFGQAPRPARIGVLEVKGGDGQLSQTVQKAITTLATSLPDSRIQVDRVARQFDARRTDFHHVADEQPYDGTPQVLVGLSVEKVDGADHLFANYAGVGPVSGPGMVAAPPDRGINLGPVVGLTASKLLPFAAVVVAAAQIYRGQTSETLSLLKQTLDDQALQGPLRWHARDQFAMRWLGLSRFHEAMWLVQEDMALARSRDDRDAYLNALGTAVRLYDQKDLASEALALSTEYLEARKAEKPDAPYRAALSMHVEMLLGANRVDDARVALSELEGLCVDGCDGDLTAMYSAAFWATPQKETALQSEILGKVTARAEAEGGDALAALRVLQGLRAMGDANLEEALIGFLEAERLYDSLHYRQGVARAQYFRMLTEMARREPEAALAAGMSAIEIQRELQDFSDVSIIYERLAGLYQGFDANQEPGPYLASAAEVLAENVQSALAQGHYGRAGESLFTMATFLSHLGQMDDAKILLRRAVGFTLEAARFELTSLCHLSLAHIARIQGNAEEFAREVANARLMADISGDETVKEVIERSLTPPQPKEEDPTRLL